MPKNAITSVNSPLLVTYEEAGRMLSLTTRTLRRMVASRDIPFLRVGRQIRFDPADLRKWIEAKKHPTRRARTWRA